MKKIFVFLLGILLVGAMFSLVAAFSSDEDEEGNPMYVADGKVVVPSININQLFVLRPTNEPLNPEIGMIYFDSDSLRLKLYDGTGWYALALEKVSSVSKQQVKEKVEKKGESETCEESVECGEWGDCINNYQTMTCITVDENCNKYTDTETRDCESKFELPAKASEGSTTASSPSSSSSSSESSSESEEEVEEEAEAEPEPAEEVEEEVEEEAEEQEEEEEVEEEAEAEPEPEPEPAEEVPEELFDITFDLEENSLNENDKLVAWITLQNFGKRYVPARLVYVITDTEGTEVYREFEEVRVYTDQAVIKRFDDLNLKKGDYVLKLHVEYAGIVEEFSDNFSVSSGVFGAIVNWFKRVF